MKNLSGDFLGLLKSETPTLARCWKITQGTLELGFTNFTQDLEFAGLTYKASLGFIPTDIEAGSGGNPYNLELSSILSEVITAEDLRSGMFSYARVEVFLVDFTNLPSSIGSSPYDYLPLFFGYIGQISYTEDTFRVELLSQSNFLESQINSVTSNICRYTFGDSNCTVDLATKTDLLAVQNTGANNSQFVSGTDTGQDYYSGSPLTWVSGDNVGQVGLVIKSAQQNFFCQFPFKNQIQIGDQFQVIVQCDKTVSNCRTFDNYLNFGGEPNLPGLDSYYSNESQS